MELQRFPDSDTRTYDKSELLQQAKWNIAYLTGGDWKPSHIGTKNEFAKDFGWDVPAKSRFKQVCDKVYGVTTSAVGIGKAKTVGEACEEIAKVLKVKGRFV